MRFSTLLLILVSVTLSTSAQLLLKKGMSNAAIVSALDAHAWARAGAQVATSPWVVGGLLAFGSSAVVWLMVLARVQVSFAYPFVGIGFIATMLMGWWLLGDAMNPPRVLGTLMIAAGVVLVARGG